MKAFNIKPPGNARKKMITVVHSLNAKYSVVMILLKQLGLIGHYNYMKMQKNISLTLIFQA